MFAGNHLKGSRAQQLQDRGLALGESCYTVAGTFLGRMWFLPGVKWFKMRHLPYEETEVSIPD